MPQVEDPRPDPAAPSKPLDPPEPLRPRPNPEGGGHGCGCQRAL